MKSKASPEVQQQALKVASGIKKPGQTKEQTKLIAQGIEKGIAEYKKQQSAKLREKDKARKQKLKRQVNSVPEITEPAISEIHYPQLPWLLLVISWIGFIAYIAY